MESIQIRYDASEDHVNFTFANHYIFNTEDVTCVECLFINELTQESTSVIVFKLFIVPGFSS